VLGVAVGVAVGPAKAGPVNAMTNPNTVRLQSNFVNRVITVISPEANRPLDRPSASIRGELPPWEAGRSWLVRMEFPSAMCGTQVPCHGAYPHQLRKPLASTG
jgi:hypothetical protein